ncbi:MAG: class I SAM-dependent methyltransferase [Terriglobales bacterium]
MHELLAAPIHDFPIRDEILYQFAPEVAGLRIAEIGPGGGFTAYGLIPVAQQMTLIDFAEATIQDLREKLASRGSATCLQADVSIPGLGARIPERYDLIFGLDVFEYVRDADACLRNLWTMLDSNGVLFLTFPNQPAELGDGALRFATTHELRAALARAGFSRSEVLSVRLTHYARMLYCAFHEWPLRLYRCLRRPGPARPQTYETTWAFQHRGSLERSKSILNGYWGILGALLRLGGSAFQRRPLADEALGHQLVVSAFKEGKSA